jgi:hypothetical protein
MEFEIMTDIILPTNGEWCLLKEPTGHEAMFPSSGKITRIDIIAWLVRSDCAPVPITAFGPADVSGEYMVQGPAGHFQVMPNGPILHDYNHAREWLIARSRAGAK